MGLLQEWRDYAYKFDDRTKEGQQFWLTYFNIEKGIYEKLLADRDVVVTGTVKELADKYETDLQTMVGFLDGINDSLKEPNPIEEMDENTQVSLDRNSGTVVKGKKIGRNDPCPCGSGKKYKKCCGRNA